MQVQISLGSVANAPIEESLDAMVRLGEGCAAERRALALENLRSMKL